MFGSKLVRSPKAKVSAVLLGALFLIAVFAAAGRMIAVPITAVDRNRVDTTASEPKYIRMVAVGDSYTDGTALGGQEAYENWVDQDVVMLRKSGINLEVRKNASGGSGYVNPGPRRVTFGELVPRYVNTDTQLVVLFGSRNDIGEVGLPEAVRRVLADVRLRAPRAKVVVVAPPWTSENVPAGAIQIRDELKLAAEASGYYFVDPISEQWFFGQDSRLISSDGTHPTTDGHAYMARKLLPHLRGVIQSIQQQ